MTNKYALKNVQIISDFDLYFICLERQVFRFSKIMTTTPHLYSSLNRHFFFVHKIQIQGKFVRGVEISI